jgi:hypothetical protein
LPDRDELLAVLATKAREGNVRAVELLLRETPRDERASSPSDRAIWRQLLAVPNPDAS